LDREGNILLDRYEWFLYQQIPERLNGKLTLPAIIKYRALDAALINSENWRKNKYTLLELSQLAKLAKEPLLPAHTHEGCRGCTAHGGPRHKLH
jgi:hypothetical protein